MNIIALTGPKGTGKSTLAAHLVRLHGYRHFSFAQPIREMAKVLVPELNWDHLTTAEKETPVPWLGVTPRHILQTLGTEWGREQVSPEVWVRVMLHTLDQAAKAGVRRAVVDDVRFPNEAEALLARGAELYGMRREAPQDAPDGHSSEAFYELLFARARRIIPVPLISTRIDQLQFYTLLADQLTWLTEP
jgi:hypothetical protein